MSATEEVMAGCRNAWLLVQVPAGLLSFAVAVLAGTGCHHPAESTDSGASVAAPPVPELPAPFAAVRIGMTDVELKTMFPPLEDITNCAPRLVGGDAAIPTQIPGAEKNPRSRCARTIDIAGMTSGELSAEADWMKKVDDVAVRSGRDASDYRAGGRDVFAQIRGSIRAATVPEAALVTADRGTHATAFAAVDSVETDLVNGAIAFAEEHTTRRTLSALISDGCDDLDADRVSKYVSGGYTLATIDADAHSRVVYGKCRGPFLQGEKKLQTKLLRRAGGLAGVGLARASRTDHQLNPDDPATFAIYSSRSKLDQPVAKFGVMIANALPQTEAYWHGAVVLLPGEGAKTDWRSAVVWIRDGKVARILVNITADDKLGDLPKTLADIYGAPGTTQGTVTTWSLAGNTARLDIGGAVSLVLESPSAHSMVSTTSTATVASAASATATTVTAQPTSTTIATMATPTATTAAVVAGHGTLNVGASGGWCNVAIDGAPKGPTPQSGLELSSGPHRVTCTTGDGKTQSATVNVPVDGTARQKFEL